MVVLTRLRTAGVVVFATALLTTAFAIPARADSQALAVFGNTALFGDGQKHQFEVYDSAVDLAKYDWDISGNQRTEVENNSTFMTQVDLAMLPQLMGLGHDYDDPTGSKLSNFWNSMTSGTVYPIAVQAAINRLKAVFDRMLAVRKEIAQLQFDAEVRIIELGETVAADASEEELLQVLDDVWKTVEPTLNAKTAELDALKPGLEKTAEELRGLRSLMTKSQQAKVDKLVEQTLSKLRAFSEGGATSLKFMRVLGYLALAADGIFSIDSLLGDHRVVIHDETGSPIHAWFPCRQVVRNTTGEPLPDTVSCPAARLPVLGGLFLPITQLYISSGVKDDTIKLRLSPENNPFAAVYVNGGGGNDTIWGSAAGEILQGGDGQDTIYGKRGDDYLLGDMPLPTAPNGYNDRLFGGAGRDQVWGGAGNDLIFGGAGDDNASFGPALSGDVGNDVLIGGPGKDAMEGGPGSDTLFAKESDFPRKVSGAGKQADEIDDRVSCGYDARGVINYVTVSPGVNPATGIGELSDRCDGPPDRMPTINEILQAAPDANGKWPWYR